MTGVTVTAVAINQASAETTTLGKPENFMDEVDRTVEEISNGIVVTLTTEDATALEKLKNMPSDMGNHGMPNGDITRTVELLDNGVKITMTSDDADTIERLQSDDMPMGPKVPQEFEDMNITRTVENIDNGIVITITSDDADTVQKLQENQGEFRPFGHHGGMEFYAE